ncbi:MAG: membrane integrity-associated transporter subunit PqiC [Candidatus Cloacimonetes bacterium]|nr:membrane integrity-associated transporter subunit PqiC [Candidatus Cloacimonadota bacterium]
MNKKYMLICLVLVLVLLSACSSAVIQTKKYYILEYKPVKENNDLKQKKPLNYAVRVLDAEMPRIYDRKQIVIKSSDNMIEYDYNNLWADRLNPNISNLILTRLMRYNVFKQVFTDFQQKADYEVVTKVNTIEFIDYQSKWAAHLNLEIYLRRTSDNQFVLRHFSDKNIELYDKRIEHYVQTINDMIMDETDRFIEKTLKKLNSNGNGKSNGLGQTDFMTETDSLANETDSSYVEMDNDDTDFSSLGTLFVPVKTDPDYEPSYSIYNEYGKLIETAMMGQDVLLEPGKYQLKMGTNEKIEKTVEVLPRYKHVVKPEWGWLTVNVVDENRDEMDIRYELFDLASTESYGFGIGIKEGLGQKLQAWVLPAGFYKVVLNNYPFNTYTDFATIEVKEGILEQMTVVVDSETKRMLGAGKMLQDDLFAKSNLKNNLLLHFNANVNFKNDVEKNKFDFSSVFNVQGDHKLIYDAEPYYFSMKTLIEQGVTKSSGVDMNFSMDKVDVKNTFVYTLIKFFGLYARQDLNTHLWPENLIEKDEKKYIMIDIDNNADTLMTKKLQVKSSFYPLVSKTGAGFNFRVNNNISFRTGVGLRHDVNKDYYIFDSQQGDYYVYKETKSVRQTGVEASLYGNIPIPLLLTDSKLSWTTNFDLLKPIDNDSKVNIDWENTFNLPIYKKISLDYRLNMNYNEDVKDYVVFDSAAFIRFTMIISR